MKFFKRKGQAALEFLTTYGWAFLVILVMIGALAGFGILTPSNFLPDRCNFATELSCSEGAVFKDSSDVTTTVFLMNNLGNTLELNSDDVNMTTEYGGLNNCYVASSQGSDETVAAGKTVNITCSSTDPSDFPAAGEKLKVQVELDYIPLGKSLPKHVQGELYTDIQDAS